MNHKKFRSKCLKSVKVSVLIYACLIILGGCVHQELKPSEEAEKPKQLTEMYGAKVVLLDKCPITGDVEEDKQVKESGFLGTLFGIVGPALIQTGVGVLGEAVKKAAGDGDKHTSLSANTHAFFYHNKPKDKKIPLDATEVNKVEDIPAFLTTQNQNTKCIVFFYGKHGLKDPLGIKAKTNSWKPEGYFPGTKSHDWRWWDKLQIKEPPKFYMEAGMAVPKGRNQFQINPQLIWYNERFNNNGFDKKRDLELRFSLISSDTDDDKGSSGSIILFDVPVGHFIGGEDISSFKTGFMPQLPKDAFFASKESARQALTNNAASALKTASDGTKESESRRLARMVKWKQCLLNGKKEHCEKEAEIKGLIKKRDKILAKEARDEIIERVIEEAEEKPILGSPFKMSVTVTETRDINKWLLAIGEALASKKEAISTEVARYVIPGQRETAKLEEQTTANTNNSAYLVAMIDVDIAQKALKVAEASKDEAAILTKKKELIQKKAAANAAAITVGKAIPFPEVM
uniref:Lipoprotein n=1 Tax=Candidatus Kentrum eta TaxID=2126337 RepID=A0A450VIT0_9GAMM|nr:MAG: hypothetical protein BECKH772A_GA0070896_101944 [Candidatus Kentron sp. H]VFK00635.1 MAG: hypothetical protein BECKH772B_GA0070898_101974 [Candidatus Kentron sp. H]VFK04631.1 MAG: hypothetical protein BECKH772C_GA0070978_101944 [Candidatus Kentron sp. H]